MLVSRTLRTCVAHFTLYEFHEILLIQVRDPPFYSVYGRK